uniref:Uncharacterized protein n=1 Tax=Glossina pallidipes TaxID=7398 RepID=A0A1A9ZBE9_GLOPL
MCEVNHPTISRHQATEFSPTAREMDAGQRSDIPMSESQRYKIADTTLRQQEPDATTDGTAQQQTTPKFALAASTKRGQYPSIADLTADTNLYHDYYHQQFDVPSLYNKFDKKTPTAKGLSTKCAPIVANVDTIRTSLANGPASQRWKARGTMGHSTNGRRVLYPLAPRYRKTIAPCSTQATGSTPPQIIAPCSATIFRCTATNAANSMRPTSGLSRRPATINNTRQTDADTERPHRRDATAVTFSPKN